MIKQLVKTGYQLDGRDLLGLTLQWDISTGPGFPSTCGWSALHCAHAPGGPPGWVGCFPQQPPPFPGRAEHAGAQWVCNASVNGRRSAELNHKTGSAPSLGCCQHTPQVSRSELANQLSFVFMIFLNEKFGEGFSHSA